MIPDVKRTLPSARRAASKKRMTPSIRNREPIETRPTPISVEQEQVEGESISSQIVLLRELPSA